MRSQRIERMPGFDEQGEPNLHKSVWTKRPLAMRRLDRRRRNRAARRARRATR